MSTDDRTAISENIYAYSYHWDGQDIESFLTIFTDDPVWEFIAHGASKPEVHLASIAAMRAFATERLGRRKGKFTSRHFQTNIVFDRLDADSAETRTMVVVTHQNIEAPAPPALFLTAVYHDLHQRTSRGWRIKRRTVRHDMPTSLVSNT